MPFGIYIHIPFCRHKCKYCDFNSYVAESGLYSVYTDALCKEISATQVTPTKVDSVYFGGGTPTVMPPEYLVRILDTVRSRFALTDDCEITTECNPATIDKDGFLQLLEAGFNRVSVGVQSADDGLLKKLGRIHSFDDAERCIKDAKEAGFKNISADLMFALPDQNLEVWSDTLLKATALDIEHISCYALKIEEGTPFANMKLSLADDEESRKMYDFCVDFLNEKGFLRYEISNFARPGFESRHNIKYWRCEDFAGFGPGAYSCGGDKRYSNILDTTEYIERIKRGQEVVSDTIPLDNDSKMSEFVFLGLRMDKGIDIEEFEKRFSVSIYDIFADEIEKNIKRGTMIKEGSRLKIAPEFVYVSNAILADFV